MAKVDYTEQGNVPFARPDGWVEIHEPELFNFADIGQRLCGVLCDLRFETIEKRPVLTARMEMDSGAQVKFRPSFDLQQKLGKRLLGKKVLIVFDQERDTGQENRMKIFRVFVAPGPEAVAPFVATEDDLPEGAFDEPERAAG